MNFNPRTRVGCDAAFCGCSALKTAFQSTHPHGVRPVYNPTGICTKPFQSTHPHGVRLAPLIRPSADTSISIHAPAWGATARSSTLPTKVKISIHAPAWGATQGVVSKSGCPNYFNPRTRMGCDYSSVAFQHCSKKFQSTHPHGVRPPLLILAVYCHCISIHAPAWGATIPGGGSVNF